MDPSWHAFRGNAYGLYLEHGHYCKETGQWKYVVFPNNHESANRTLRPWLV
jgi:hypothetical protein